MAEYANDRRLTTRVLKYWDRLCPALGELPPYASFQSAAMADVWAQCMVVSVSPSQGDRMVLKCEHSGSAVQELFGDQLRMHITVSSTHKLLGKKFVDACEQAAKRREPTYDKGNFLNDGTDMMKYRSCFLPFVDTSGQVTHLLVGLTWRVFT